MHNERHLMNTDFETGTIGKTTVYGPVPPMDGRPVVVEGKVMIPGEFGMTAEPVVGRMRWDEKCGDWKWYLGGLVVRQFADAELVIHAWADAPCFATGRGGLHFAGLRAPAAVDYDCD